MNRCSGAVPSEANADPVEIPWLGLLIGVFVRDQFTSTVVQSGTVKF
jgi:hypothetical protein